MLFGALGYFISALLSLRLRKDELGPTKVEITSADKNWKDGFSQMREGFSYL